MRGRFGRERLNGVDHQRRTRWPSGGNSGPRIHLGRLRDDDELGRVNLITPEKVLQGVREVEAGVSFCLSLPLDYPAAPR